MNFSCDEELQVFVHSQRLLPYLNMNTPIVVLDETLVFVVSSGHRLI